MRRLIEVTLSLLAAAKALPLCLALVSPLIWLVAGTAPTLADSPATETATPVASSAAGLAVQPFHIFLPIVLRDRLGPTYTPTNTPTNSPTSTPTSTPTNTPIPGLVTIFQDNFDGAFPGPWIVTRTVGYADAYWGQESCQHNSGSFSVWPAGAGTTAQPCGAPYLNNMNAWMVYGPFSLANTISATAQTR